MKILKIEIKFLRYFILFYFFILILFYHSINIIAFEDQQKYKILDIIIEGNKTISNLEIENFLNIKKEKIVFIDKLINLEEDLLNWGYFYSVKVNIEQISQNQINDNISINNDNENNILYDIIEIIIQIELYENLPVKCIRIKNENIYLSNIKSRMKLKENKAFNPKFLEKDLQNITLYPFVSRVSSTISETESSISIEIFIKLKNEISSEIILSSFLIADFNYHFGKSYIPFYISALLFYPLESNNYLLTFSTSAGISFFKNSYFNIILSSQYSEISQTFDINNLSFGLNLKKQFIKDNKYFLFFNPLSYLFSLNLGSRKPDTTSLYSDLFFNFKRLFSFFLKSSLTYYFSEKNFIYGNVPYNGLETTFIINSNYNQFFYINIFDSFVFRSEPYQIIDNGRFVLSTSADLILKIYSTQIFYVGLILSFDFLFINKEEDIIKFCQGLGIVFSISVKNILSVPLTIQYFWDNNIKSGVFYFTILSKRFS